MKKMKKIILVMSLIIVIGITMWYLFLWNTIPDEKPIYKKIEIKSEADKNSIFLKQKVWGMTSDNNVIIISKSSSDDFEINNESDFIFKETSPFFYRFNSDSLIVYVQHKVVPPLKSNFKLVIIQVELSNTEMMNLLENDSYKKKGLTLF
jgi:hypothetical protein